MIWNNFYILDKSELNNCLSNEFQILIRMLEIKESVSKELSVKIMTWLIFGQNFDCVSGEISAAFPFLCLQRRRMGLNFSFEGFFTLLNTLALAARVVVVLEQCPFIADFFALAAFQVHQRKILTSGLSLCSGGFICTVSL